jgi:hypothetical protein
VAQEVEEADGFAQVFPEHKFHIVEALQSGGHIVGMTGDGANDAPALKQADAGIAVSGATDAARSAAALVLTAPGLSVIVRAVEEARRIFERMNSYAIYRITETIRIMFFVVLAMIVFNFYPVTTIMIILLALLNDLPILTIAYDNTWLSDKPVRWEMRRVLTAAAEAGGGRASIVFVPEAGRGRPPDAVRGADQASVLDAALSGPGAGGRRGGHPGGGGADRGLRHPGGPHPLVLRGADLGLLPRVGVCGGRRQAARLQAPGAQRPAPSQLHRPRAAVAAQPPRVREGEQGAGRRGSPFTAIPG